MLEKLMKFLNKLMKKENDKIVINSKEAAKERLHLVLMQDRANVSSDFLELMKKEIIDVIKKYIVVDEKEIDVRLTNRVELDGSNGAPALYANIPIINIKEEHSKYCPNLDVNGVIAAKKDVVREEKKFEIKPQSVETKIELKQEVKVEKIVEVADKTAEHEIEHKKVETVEITNEDKPEEAKKTENNSKKNKKGKKAKK